MKRSFPLLLAAALAALLFSSCVYDPSYSGYGGSGYYNTGYHGGYHGGVYSDLYVGYHSNRYRYRHTRCSHCNAYPCRGGHTTRYHTYIRNYPKPLHGKPRHGDHYASHGGNHSDRDRSSNRSHSGNSYGHFGIFDSQNRRGTTSSGPRNQPTSSSRTSGPRGGSMSRGNSSSRDQGRSSGGSTRFNPQTTVSTGRTGSSSPRSSHGGGLTNPKAYRPTTTRLTPTRSAPSSPPPAPRRSSSSSSSGSAKPVGKYYGGRPTSSSSGGGRSSSSRGSSGGGGSGPGKRYGGR